MANELDKLRGLCGRCQKPGIAFLPSGPPSVEPFPRDFAQ
jgi:hypothetical protein